MKSVVVAILLNAIFQPVAFGFWSFYTTDRGLECTERISQRESQYVPYPETYKVRKWGLFSRVEARLNYKREYSTVWITRKCCCPGYREQSGVCKPICPQDCGAHAYCASPNTCQCIFGYVEKTNVTGSRDNGPPECVPICSPQCENGVCVWLNQCVCSDGYGVRNDSHKCLPICRDDCEKYNARCTAPNTCSCNTGYEKVGNTTLCTPVCREPCVNGQCTEPDVCSCHAGYERHPSNASLCEPKCENGCSFGTCQAPDTCVCDPGYKPVNDSFCEPVCSNGCEMGLCVAPETCSCHDGYGLLEDSSHVCVPICEKGCVNGTCSSPGTCVCSDGYRLNETEEMHACRPFCELPCEPHGVCVAPNTCNCMQGYGTVDAPDNNTASACQPICAKGCGHGNCVDPDVCSCDRGYRPSTDSSNICEPICEPVCESNSTCTEPSVCTCLAGYQPVQNNITNGCEPRCEPNCARNSSCTAPNVCTCDEGFVKDSLDRCEPVCTSGCVNSTCVEPNVCQCLKGYAQLNDSICVPFCENCENGECIGPNQCRRNNTDSCTRSCTGHGVCTDEKRSCECFFGWTGWDCDQPSVSILFMNLDDENVKRVNVQNETNSTLNDARDNAPYCYQCNECLSNESLCFTIRWDDDTPAVGCFIDTESPCYMMYQQRNTAAMSTAVGTLAVITILIMAGATTAGYLMTRRQQRKETLSVIARDGPIQGSTLNESLLSEEDACLCEPN